MDEDSRRLSDNVDERGEVRGQVLSGASSHRNRIFCIIEQGVGTSICTVVTAKIGVKKVFLLIDCLTTLQPIKPLQ